MYNISINADRKCRIDQAILLDLYFNQILRDLVATAYNPAVYFHRNI